MAKKKEKSDKKLMPSKEVTVKSQAYGVHTRAARGGKTPVGINDAFKDRVAKTVVINSVAKRVHDLLKHCGKPFKEAMLWQVMLSRMRKAKSADTTELLKALEGMELNSKYPLVRFVQSPRLEVNNNKKKMVVRFANSMPPPIKSKDTQYKYELYLLLLGKEVKNDVVMIAGSAWMNAGDTCGEMVFNYELPGKVKYYLACLHFACGKDGKETGTLASRGMGIVGVGKGIGK